MGKSETRNYNRVVRDQGMFSGRLSGVALPAGALLLATVFVGVLGCADEDSGSAVHASGAGGVETAIHPTLPTGGESGSAEVIGGKGGSGGSTGSPRAGAPSLGEAGAGGTSGADSASVPNGGRSEPPTQCYNDADCDDGLYCNGPEYCKTLSPNSDLKVCMRPEHGPCDPSSCDEAAKKCDCTNPDRDGDGFPVEGCARDNRFDCDDSDGNRHPGGTEECDDHDEDCREETVGVQDADKDGFTSKACTNKLFYQPVFPAPGTPLITQGTDCSDNDPASHPGAVEVCDGRDNNCNGQIDEVSGAPGDAHTYYQDQDGDYWGSDETTDKTPLQTLCNFPPPGYSTLRGDCDDLNPRINPGREEICDGVDNDCDGTIDQPEKPGDLIFGQPYDGGETEFACMGGSGWAVKTCPAARLDCNASYLDACETIGNSLCNCHQCGKTCGFSCGAADCEELVALSTGDVHTCGIFQASGSTTGGTVACWGHNNLGQLGNGSTKDSPRALAIPDLANVTAIASGEKHSCVLTSDARLRCWGDNKYGQLGAAFDPVTNRFVAFPVPVYQPPDLVNAKRIASGASHSCAIFDEGRLACWGRGDSGQLGSGETNNVISPIRVQRLVNGNLKSINDASQIVAGYEHSCALSGGKVECWGDNSSQQLGVDPTDLESSNYAVSVPGLEGLQIDALSASAYHTCARAGADVYCWGSNSDHELALASGDSAGPTKIALPAPAVSIATGSYFGCALTDVGRVYCWGSNDAGELGPNYDPNSVAPSLIPLTDVTGIFGGDGQHVCATVRGGQTRCWGNNDYGELGNGGSSDSPQPAPSRVLSLNGSQTCAPGN